MWITPGPDTLELDRCVGISTQVFFLSLPRFINHRAFLEREERERQICIGVGCVKLTTREDLVRGRET